MIIEIRRAGFVNKGAELMLHSALKQLKQEFPKAQFVMAPVYGGRDSGAYGSYIKQAELGFLQKAWLWRYGIQWGGLVSIIPAILREMYGVVLDKQVDVVIDAAGFAYSDQWGYSPTAELAQSCSRWRKQGTKVILLPQALGPFTSQKHKRAIRRAVDNADLIFARESISYEHLVEVVGERSNIKIAPDFTNLLDGVIPDHFEKKPNQYCIVPNYRMIDKVTKEQRDAYLPFMINCAKYLQSQGLNPFILLHEKGNDFVLAQKIREGAGGNLPIITESHPLKIKGILGTCEGTIGSRYHGLVSALCQGVPSLATGWSHKYRMLFEDYGFGDGLLDSLAGEIEMKRKINLIVEPKSRLQLKETLRRKSKAQKQLSQKMWFDVFQIIKNH